MLKSKPTRGTGLLETYLAKKRAKKANLLIPKSLRNGKILDIGCGSFPYFLFNTNFKEKYGIDPSLNTQSTTGITLKKLKVEEKIPFQNSFFDVVTILAVFEHIDDKNLEAFLNDIFRVLKPGGAFIITTPSPWVDSLLHFMGRIRLISPEEIEEHKHNHKQDKIEVMLESVGFKKEKIESGFFEIKANRWFKAVK
jgi:ubiquinone/menaquinone biosynthesis C-methylase UbiE